MLIKLYPCNGPPYIQQGKIKNGRLEFCRFAPLKLCQKNHMLIINFNFVGHASWLRYQHGEVTLNAEAVPSTNPKEGLHQFLQFLEKCPTKPFIIGHNIQNFDMPILMYHLKHFGLLQQFSECTSGFIDTYKVASKVYSKAAVGNFKQETLVKHFLDKDYDAHNALSDVLAYVSSMRKFYLKNVSRLIYSL